jgi:hypothetical protein
MQPLDERQCIEIERPDMVELRLSFGGLDRFHNGLHHDAFPYIFVTCDGPCFPPIPGTIKAAIEDRLKL